MRGKLILGLVAVAALLAGVLVRTWLSDDDVPAPEPAAGLPALNTELRLSDPDGRPHSLGEWKGRVLVVNFWASWCEPCRTEMPEFVRIQDELGRRGLQFVGIALDDSEAVQDFLRETPVNYPILIGGDDAMAWAERLGNRYSVLPFSVVFDRSGAAVHAQAGVFHREDLVGRVGPLLGPENEAR